MLRSIDPATGRDLASFAEADAAAIDVVLTKAWNSRDTEEAISVANDSDLGLGTAIWATHDERGRRVAERASESQGVVGVVGAGCAARHACHAVSASTANGSALPIR